MRELAEERGRIGFLVCWSVALLALLSALSSAEARAEERVPDGYTEAVNQGIRELESGNYPEAREEFRRAHALYPNARTYRGLGIIAFELRNYIEAADYLSEALASRVKPLDASLREQTEAVLARAKRYIGELAIRIEGPGATVTIDGEPVPRREREPLQVVVGEHVLEVRAPGGASERRVIEVVGGERIELHFTLPAAGGNLERSGATAASDARSDVHSEARPWHRKWWVWTLAAVAVGGATATALVLTRDEPRTTPIESANTPGVSLSTLSRF